MIRLDHFVQISRLSRPDWRLQLSRCLSAGRNRLLLHLLVASASTCQKHLVVPFANTIRFSSSWVVVWVQITWHNLEWTWHNNSSSPVGISLRRCSWASLIACTFFSSGDIPFALKTIPKNAVLSRLNLHICLFHSSEESFECSIVFLLGLLRRSVCHPPCW